MFDFSNSEEQKGSGPLSFVTCGIHDFKVKKIFYQPAGESKGGETKKDGSLVNFSKDQVRIELDVLKTHTGADCKGAKVFIGILDPTDSDPKKFKGRMDRIVHIFCNMASSSKKAEAKEFMQKIKAKNMEELAKKLAPLAGKDVRYKFTADQEGKYAQLPNYYSGFAECADVPFEKSILKFDESKEGIKKKDSNKVEAKGPEVDLFGGSNTSTTAPQITEDEQDLPF